MGCPLANEPLGADYIAACGEDGQGARAKALNVLFYEEAEAVLARVSRIGLPMVMKPRATPELDTPVQMAKLVQRCGRSSSCSRAARSTPAGTAA